MAEKPEKDRQKPPARPADAADADARRRAGKAGRVAADADRDDILAPATPVPTGDDSSPETDEILKLMAGDEIDRILASGGELAGIAQDMAADEAIARLADSDTIAEAVEEGDRDAGLDKGQETPSSPTRSAAPQSKATSARRPQPGHPVSRQITITRNSTRENNPPSAPAIPAAPAASAFADDEPMPSPGAMTEQELDVLFGSPVPEPAQEPSVSEQVAAENEQSVLAAGVFDPGTALATPSPDADDGAEAEVEKSDLQRIIEAELAASGTNESVADEPIDALPNPSQTPATPATPAAAKAPDADAVNAEEDYSPPGATVIAMNQRLADEMLGPADEEARDDGDQPDDEPDEWDGDDETDLECDEIEQGSPAEAPEASGPASPEDIERMINAARGDQTPEVYADMDEESHMAAVADADDHMQMMSMEQLDEIFGRDAGGVMSRASATLSDADLAEYAEKYGAEAVSLDHLDELFGEVPSAAPAEDAAPPTETTLETETSPTRNASAVSPEQIARLHEMAAQDDGVNFDEPPTGSLSQAELDQLFANAAGIDDSPATEAEASADGSGDLLSQDDLDKLFDQAAGTDDSPAAEAEAPADDSGDLLSQDDLDKLFDQAAGTDDSPAAEAEAPADDSGDLLSQDDLDKLFDQAAGVDESSAPPVQAKTEDDGGGSLSQEDLDKLFAQAAGSDLSPAAPDEGADATLSQEDLDRLFDQPTVDQNNAAPASDQSDVSSDNLDEVISQSIEQSPVVAEERELQQIIDKQQRAASTAPQADGGIDFDSGVAPAEAAALRGGKPAGSTRPEPVDLPVGNFNDLEKLLDHRDEYGLPMDAEPEKSAAPKLVQGSSNAKAAKPQPEPDAESDDQSQSLAESPQTSALKLKLFRLLAAANAPFESLSENAREYAAYAAVALLFGGMMMVITAIVR